MFTIIKNQICAFEYGIYKDVKRDPLITLTLYHSFDPFLDPIRKAYKYTYT